MKFSLTVKTDTKSSQKKLEISQKKPDTEIVFGF